MFNREEQNSELRLMALAARNPSLGGRELMIEIIERGPMPEPTERPQLHDIREALKARSLDDPEYRTRPEQADWIGKASKELRDLYEHGAEINGEVLTIPAEDYELRNDNDAPFITTLSYAQSNIGDINQAREFHTLAHAISGEMADARMQIAVFKHYYNQLELRVSRESRWQARESNHAESIESTLTEMRNMAGEMAKLETRVSIESLEARNMRQPESYEVERIDVGPGPVNISARKVNLRDESLRFPAGLSFETKERLVTKTIPEIDRRFEVGISRESLLEAVNNTFFGLSTREINSREFEERGKIAGFLKSYIDGRLRDPEARTLNSSSAFRKAHETIINSSTPEEVGRAAASILRANQGRSEELRQHQNDPDRHPLPAVLPLNSNERNLLFYGRSPDHHTCEMRELRINYGLSRAERNIQVEKLHHGLMEPSDPLKQMIDELAMRKTAKAIRHFQASLLNDQMDQRGRTDLNNLYNRIPPHERTYLFELTERRKQALLKSQEYDSQEKFLTHPASHEIGVMPIFSHSNQSIPKIAAQTFISNEQQDHEPRVSKTPLAGYVDGEQEWHFDSLRDVLNQERFKDDEMAREYVEYTASREGQDRAMDR